MLFRSLHEDLARTVTVGESGRQQLAQWRILFERRNNLVIDLMRLYEFPDLGGQIRWKYPPILKSPEAFEQAFDKVARPVISKPPSRS